MNRTRNLTVLALVLLIIGFVLIKHRTPRAHAMETPPPALAKSVGAATPTPTPAASPAQVSKSAPATPQQLESLSRMTKTLFEFVKPNRKLKDLTAYLKASGQNPFVTRDHNAYTGDMMIVRTRSPLPGTRYFHAQYFGDEHTEAFVQHMSFEFKPGPQALQQALDAVKGSFPNLGRPSFQKDDFAQWDLPEGYVVWVKRMGPTDLADNPFNAYGPEDVGTIRIAVELNPEEN